MTRPGTVPLLLRGGRVIDPAQGLDGPADVLLADGRVAAVGAGLAAPEGARVVDCGGLVVAPGFIDLHVHLREPGQEHKEDIASGTRAAAAGGFTTVVCIPNTRPVLDTRAAIEFVRRRAAEVGVTNVLPMGAVTRGQHGKELADIGELAEAGAVAVTDDGNPVENGDLMRNALRYAAHFGLPVASHAEVPELTAGGVMHFGDESSRLGLRGIPSASEAAAVARDLLLAELTGGRLHVMHVSAAETVDLLRWGKARGIRVTAEVTPHHLVLTDAAVGRMAYDPCTKVNPPLRTERDRQALIAGLLDGTIDCLATDHAPHHADDKDVEYEYAAFGISGLETAVGLCLTHLVGAGILDLPGLVARFTAAPARVLGLAKGTLAVGADADVTVLDPGRAVVVDPARFYSKGKNTPFAGARLIGGPVMTIVGGRVVMEDGRVVV